MSAIGLFEQYRYVGPALFELGLDGGNAALVRKGYTGEVAEPKEAWLPINTTWLRLNGEWISGWDNGFYFAFRPHWLNRLKIRLAARRWLALQEQGA